MYTKHIKRSLDVLCSLIGLILASPLFGAIACWIKFDSKGPVIFQQRRVGKDKSIFMIFKFRTMRLDTPSDMPTHLLNDPDRFLTRSGRFLRKSSLDELPQLYNVLRGDMSFIGPRPALWNQYDLVAERDRYGANGVRPGLTGWAQINGRDELPIPVKARLDGEYVARISFAMDVKCLMRTVGSVISGTGYAEGAKERPAASIEQPQENEGDSNEQSGV